MAKNKVKPLGLNEEYDLSLIFFIKFYFFFLSKKTCEKKIVIGSEINIK